MISLNICKDNMKIIIVLILASLMFAMVGVSSAVASMEANMETVPRARMNSRAGVTGFRGSLMCSVGQLKR